MTFLSAAQKAAIRLVGRKPTTFFSSTKTFELEIVDLANEVAADIMQAHDWRLLTELNVVTGNGADIGFSLPTDYDRMLLKGSVFRPDWSTWRYTPADDLDQWQDLLNGTAAVDPGFWIILQGELQFWPILPTGEIAQHYYISKNVVADENGAPKAEFTTDTDSLRLDESLLTLGLIWRWREQKRLDFSGDKENYDQEIEETSAREKGRRIFAVGGCRPMEPFGPFGMNFR